MTKPQPPTDDKDDSLSVQMQLTGLSYASWEQDSERLERAADLADRTGLLDTQHIARAEQVAAAISDEVEMVEDVQDLADSETAGQLVGVRARLVALWKRVSSVGERMRRTAGK